jgi:nucleoside phosphorylase
MPGIPVYFSHSYWREDREVNDHFWRAFHDAGFSFTVDPASPSLHTTRLELMMARSVGFVAVVPFREAEERYQCSPFILYEYGLAAQAHQPLLVLRDRRVPPRYFRAEGTLGVEFDVAVPDRCAADLERKLGTFYAMTSGRNTEFRFRKGRVGIALAAGQDKGAVQDRRGFVEEALDKEGNEVIDLNAQDGDPSQLAQSADRCDFVIVDVDDPKTSQIADFLLGRGTPLLKLAQRSAGRIVPERLLGSAPLRRAAAADELVTYWSDAAEFESRVRLQIRGAAAIRTELTDLATGHRYFRSLGREARPVFISNADPANDLARDLTQALYLENIPFFHYRFQNPIGWGERWNDQLDRIIAASKVFVPLIDDSYWSREYCQKEYSTASKLEKEGRITIVPMLLSGHEFGPDIPYQGSDLRTRSRQEQVQIIVSSLDDLLAPQDAPGAGPRHVEAGQVSVDVAIITILEQEYEAVLRLLKRKRRVTGSAEMGNQHAWVIGEIDAPDFDVPYTAVLAMSPRSGTNAAVIVTKNTLQAFDPRCVLVVGIAGGLGDLQLGDVVVADRICAYEYGKVGSEFHPRNDLDSPTDASIFSAAKTFAARHPYWFSELEHSDETRHHTPRIVVGHVASGDKVVDDPTSEFFTSVVRGRPNIAAIEMEGAGAATAVQDVREMQRGASFGMIRGISDLPHQGGASLGTQPGKSAQTKTRDSWKVPASTAAAAAAIQLIRLSWPRPPRRAAQYDAYAEFKTPARGRISAS